MCINCARIDWILQAGEEFKTDLSLSSMYGRICNQFCKSSHLKFAISHNLLPWNIVTTNTAYKERIVSVYGFYKMEKFIWEGIIVDFPHNRGYCYTQTNGHTLTHRHLQQQ